MAGSPANPLDKSEFGEPFPRQQEFVLMLSQGPFDLELWSRAKPLTDREDKSMTYGFFSAAAKVLGKLFEVVL